MTSDREPSTRATAEVREALVDYFRGKAAYRRGLAETKPWTALKNEAYADALDLVVTYLDALPDDDSTLQMLTRCSALYPRYSGCFSLPEGEDGASSFADQDAIHCRCKSADCAQWFKTWAEGVVVETEQQRKE